MVRGAVAADTGMWEGEVAAEVAAALLLTTAEMVRVEGADLAQGLRQARQARQVREGAGCEALEAGMQEVKKGVESALMLASIVVRARATAAWNAARRRSNERRSLRRPVDEAADGAEGRSRPRRRPMRPCPLPRHPSGL